VPFEIACMGERELFLGMVEGGLCIVSQVEEACLLI